MPFRYSAWLSHPGVQILISPERELEEDADTSELFYMHDALVARISKREALRTPRPIESQGLQIIVRYSAVRAWSLHRTYAMYQE